MTARERWSGTLLGEKVVVVPNSVGPGYDAEKVSILNHRQATDVVLDHEPGGLAHAALRADADDGAGHVLLNRSLKVETACLRGKNPFVR